MDETVNSRRIEIPDSDEDDNLLTQALNAQEAKTITNEKSIPATNENNNKIDKSNNEKPRDPKQSNKYYLYNLFLYILRIFY